jgi:cytochrome c-type biogenesis protein CcmH
MRKFLHGIAALFVLMAPAFAVQPDEMLSDPALEARARSLSRTLRCMVCQNESIDDSNAPLAKDLRILVRERIKAGDSDAEVREFLVARYGEFVLLSPRLRSNTLLLWGIPALVFLGGGAALAYSMSRRRRVAPKALSADEQKKLDKLLRPHKKS